MKKLFLLLLLCPALIMSCSKDNTADPEGTKGSIRLSVEMNGRNLDATRAPENPALTDLIVLLTGDGGTVEKAYPDGGVLTDIEPGNYTLKLTTHADGMPATPGFESAYWLGESGTIAVESDETAQADVNMSLQNGGVFFEFAAGLADVNIVPKVTDHNNVTITYDDKTEDVAYFAPGNDVTVTALIDGIPAKINGSASQTVAITANKVWRVKLNDGAVVDDSGSINIDVIFETVDVEDVPAEVTPGEVPQTLFVDDLVGTWSASGHYSYTYGGTRTCMLVTSTSYIHNLTISKVSDTQIQITRILNIQARTNYYTLQTTPSIDVAYATVDNEARTFDIPYQQLGYNTNNWPTYMYYAESETPEDNIGKGIEGLTVVDGVVTFPTTGFEGKDALNKVAKHTLGVMAINPNDDSDIMEYHTLFNTIWTKK